MAFTSKSLQTMHDAQLLLELTVDIFDDIIFILFSSAVAAAATQSTADRVAPHWLQRNDD